MTELEGGQTDFVAFAFKIITFDLGNVCYSVLSDKTTYLKAVIKGLNIKGEVYCQRDLLTRTIYKVILGLILTFQIICLGYKTIIKNA